MRLPLSCLRRGRRIDFENNFRTTLYLASSVSLGCRGNHLGIHAYEFPRATFVFEFHEAVDQREQRIVLTATDVLAGLPFRAALPRENVPAQHALAAKLLKSQPLRVRVATVTG